MTAMTWEHGSSLPVGGHRASVATLIILAEAFGENTLLLLLMVEF